MDNLSERERRALANADRLNAIMAQSSIASGAESAQIRAREQALARQDARRNAQRAGELDATLGVRQQEGQANRDARLLEAAIEARTLGALAGLSAGERGKVHDAEMAIGNIASATEAGQNVIDQGGEFKGIADWAIGFMRGRDWNTLPNIVANIAYTKDEKAARGKIVDATEAIRRALAGANLTGVEIGLQADSAPDAPGIDMEESLRRLASWDEKSRRAIATVTQGRRQGAAPALITNGPERFQLPDGRWVRKKRN